MSSFPPFCKLTSKTKSTVRSLLQLWTRRKKTRKRKKWARPEMMNAQGLVITYVLFTIIKLFFTDWSVYVVFMVPRHLRHCYDVRSDALDRLVRPFPSLISSTLTSFPTSYRNVVSKSFSPSDQDEIVYIGRSETAMWMRVVSSWVCVLLYSWSLVAPVMMPDR